MYRQCVRAAVRSSERYPDSKHQTAPALSFLSFTDNHTTTNFH